MPGYLGYQEVKTTSSFYFFTLCFYIIQEKKLVFKVSFINKIKIKHPNKIKIK